MASAGGCGTCGVPGEWQCIHCPRRAEVYAAPLPRCPTHGGMHYEAARYLWVCHGWDGEGCSHQVADADLPYERVGTIDQTQWADPLGGGEYAPERPINPAAPRAVTVQLPLSDAAAQQLRDLLHGNDA
jgi:hypothetical protein